MAKKSYHFDLGNTDKGAIGMCARVLADSKQEALEILQEALPEEVELKTFCVTGSEAMGRIEYVNVYINTANIKLRHIGDVEYPQET